MATQNEMERIKDRMQKGELTAAQANVEMVRCERVRVIVGSVPREVRQALNEAVKRGELAHVKKDKSNHLPEAYYHPTFEYLMNAARNEYKQAGIRALQRYVRACVIAELQNA